MNSRKEGQDRRGKRYSRDSECRERLTDRTLLSSSEKSGSSSIEFVNSVTDCCCIGPRSRLPLSRIPLSSNMGPTSPTLPQPPTRVAATAVPATQLPPNSNSNNNCGWLQTGSGISTNFNVDHSPHSQSSVPISFSFSSSSTSSSPTIVSSSTTTTATLTLPANTTLVSHSVSVPRQLAQWTKHQTLKLEVSLQRFTFKLL